MIRKVHGTVKIGSGDQPLCSDERREIVAGPAFVSDCGHWIDFMSWMSLVEPMYPQGSHQVSVVPLINKCDLFKTIQV
jgi:hypothetical protein